MFFAKGRVTLTISLAIFFSCPVLGQDFAEEFESLINQEKPFIASRKNVNYSKSIMG